MKELQNELKNMYEEMEQLKLERDAWKEKANNIEDKELRFDLRMKAQDIEKEIRNIEIDIMDKIKDLFKEGE